jgi:multisubunit Na+/H+ antiporter MnhF subunit
MTIVTNVCFGILGLAALLCAARILRPGSSLADRIVALDSLLVTFVAGLAVRTARADDGLVVNAVVAVALLGFLSTVTVARYIERRGA